MGKKSKPDDNSFFKESKVSGSRQVQLQRQKQIPKTKKGGGKMKSYPVQLGKSKQQFFKPIPCSQKSQFSESSKNLEFLISFDLKIY